MKVSFEKVVDGLNRFIAKEIYPNLNELQEFAARLVIGRLNNSVNAVKAYLLNNGFVKTFGIIDTDGMVDIEQLLAEIKQEIQRTGSLTLEIPMMGKITFKPADVDALYEEISKG